MARTFLTVIGLVTLIALATIGVAVVVFAMFRPQLATQLIDQVPALGPTSTSTPVPTESPTNHPASSPTSGRGPASAVASTQSLTSKPDLSSVPTQAPKPNAGPDTNTDRTANPHACPDANVFPNTATPACADASHRVIRRRIGAKGAAVRPVHPHCERKCRQCVCGDRRRIRHHEQSRIGRCTGCARRNAFWLGGICAGGGGRS